MLNRSMSPAERAKFDNANAAAEKFEAQLAYVAMMADVDLPEEEVSEDVRED